VATTSPGPDSPASCIPTTWKCSVDTPYSTRDAGPNRACAAHAVESACPNFGLANTGNRRFSVGYDTAAAPVSSINLRLGPHEAGLAALKAAGAERLGAGQAELDLGLAGWPGSKPLPITSSRAAHLWDALCGAYEVLGFDKAAGAVAPELVFAVRTYATSAPYGAKPSAPIRTSDPTNPQVTELRCSQIRHSDKSQVIPRSDLSCVVWQRDSRG